MALVDISQAYEISSLTNFIESNSFGVNVGDVKLRDLLNYLKNPKKFRKQLVKLSKYFSYKHGILKDTYEAGKNLPSLNYHIFSNNMDRPKYKEYEKRILEFIDNINVKQLARDTIYEVFEVGTVVWCKRNDKYIQFLDLDYLRIKKMKNGKWIPEFDLAYVDRFSTSEKKDFIDSMPPEVTLRKYIAYRQSRSADKEAKRWVELDNCYVIKSSSDRNWGYGLPYGMRAFKNLIHRDLLQKTEQAVSERIINQLVIQTIGYIESGKEKKSPTKEMINKFHSSLKDLMDRKTNIDSYLKTGENIGVGTLTVPEWVKIELLKVNIDVFPKEIYQMNMENIFADLGISSALIYGGGEKSGNYGSSSLNADKFFRHIYSIIEQIEAGLKEFFKDIVPTRTFNFEIIFSRDTIVNRKEQFEMIKDLYSFGLGSVKHLIQIATGVDADKYLSLIQYEVDELKLREKITPPPTSYTTPGDKEVGRPSKDNSKTKDYNDNDIPDIGD